MAIVSGSVSSDYANLIPNYFDKLLLDQLKPELRFYNFADKRPLPKDSGKSITWNRYNIPAVSGFLTEGTVPSAVKMTTMKVSAVLRQLGGYTEISDFTQLTTIDDSVESAVMQLGIAAAQSIDQAIRTEIYNGANNVSTWQHMLVKNSVSLYDIWGMTSVVVSAGDTATIFGGVYSASLIAVSDIRTAAMALRKLNVPTVDGSYKAIIHPAVAEDLLADTTWNTYAQNTPQGVDKWEAGLIGRAYNIDFYESTFAPAYTGSAFVVPTSASHQAYGTLVFGKGHFGVTEIDGGVKTEVIRGASKYDPLNQWASVSWKITMAAKLLNPSCGVTLWTGSNEVNSGLNMLIQL